MADTKFRSNVLTICGAVGYLAFIIAGFLKATGTPISWQFMALLLSTSSILLGVDFGLDVFNIQITTRTNADADEEGNK